MKPNNVFHKIDVISAVKHNESYCDVLDAVSSLKELWSLYQRILQENIRPSVHELKLKCSWIMQKDNDPKHTSKLPQNGWKQENLWKVMEWTNQNPNLNPFSNAAVWPKTYRWSRTNTYLCWSSSASRIFSIVVSKTVGSILVPVITDADLTSQWLNFSGCCNGFYMWTVQLRSYIAVDSNMYFYF